MMKNTWIIIRALILSVVILVIPSSGNQAMAQKKENPLKVGTYDSRIVTFAYTRSAYFNEYQVQIRKDYEAAKQAHDTVRVKELELKGVTYQHLLHQRVFGSGSASSVTDLIKDKLPELAKKTGVSMIVSKWEVPYFGPSVEIVDLTDEMAQMFNPTEDIGKSAGEIRNMPPIPLEELTINAEDY